eukprot:scaffold46069_cov31-Tisochrysis_lutea.AAC.6
MLETLLDKNKVRRSQLLLVTPGQPTFMSGGLMGAVPLTPSRIPSWLGSHNQPQPLPPGRVGHSTT